MYHRHKSLDPIERYIVSLIFNCFRRQSYYKTIDRCFNVTGFYLLQANCLVHEKRGKWSNWCIIIIVRFLWNYQLDTRLCVWIYLILLHLISCISMTSMNMLDIVLELSYIRFVWNSLNLLRSVWIKNQNTWEKFFLLLFWHIMASEIKICRRFYTYYYYLLTAIGLMPGGSVTKIGRTYRKWTYIARKQNIQLAKKQHISQDITVQYKCNEQNTRYNK
jgi:hypothetical protein